MKSLNKIVSVLALIGMVSCNSELDEVPFSTLTPENVFNTVEDVESATVGMYIGLLDPNMESTLSCAWFRYNGN